MGEWPDALQEIIDEFSEVFDDMERFELLFEWAERIDQIPPEEWSKTTRVVGCQSEAHIRTEYRDSGFHLQGASDSQIVQGLMAITGIALHGLTPGEVTGFSPRYVEEMGLMQALSPSRANGFLNMFMKVQDEARAMLG